ncbi:serine hydrolase [Staphylococcus sp. LCT-H4]|uniref:serine hydrolase domain-containing protein n=1 Tax=Staphylococcus sp. LCT-H4 TaxID=1914308 RepID=UPI0008F4FC1B|nr:serine hydrolase domain-containing protein [Staphylococcus sp. LCT-H4]OIJ30352.1 methicillin resistance protein FmtA [Staphylococcus sp. LCT-H4]
MTAKQFKQVTLIFVLMAIIIVSGYKYYQYHNETEYFGNNKKIKQHKIKPVLKTVIDDKNSRINAVNQYLEQTGFNGTMAIFERGQLKLNKGYGIKDFANNEHNHADSMYLIGSAQKFITGLMLKQLENEHKIDINEPVMKYLPYFKTNQVITLKQLILHQSGLHKYKANQRFKDLNDAVHAIKDKGIETKFYNKFRYNDANYLVLARVIEEVTGKSYVKSFDERISLPFQLNFTAFYNDLKLRNKMAVGYKKAADSDSPVEQRPHILQQYYGAGNLFMTPYDMGYLILNLQQNHIFNHKITNPFIHESFTKQYPQPYRFGFYVFEDKNRINGKFFGQVFTAYFNQDYIIVSGSNFENSNTNNERKMEYIYYQILDQGAPYNIVGKAY